MDKKKILFIINSLKFGGAERVLSNLLNSMDPSEYDIKVLTFKNILDFDIPNYVKYVSFNINKNNQLKILFSLIKFFNNEKIDLCVSFLTYTNIFVILSWVLTGKKFPLIVSERSNVSKNIKSQRFYSIKKLLVKLFYKQTDKIIVVSKGVKDDLIKKFNIPDYKIKIIYNPIDLDKIKKLSEENVDHEWFLDKVPIIIGCGRITKAKNFSMLIRAFEQIYKKINAKLVILGDGEERNNLEDLIQNLNLNDYVKILGFVKNPYKYMKRSTVFVLSSLWEGFPNVILEAMASNVAVISTDCPSGPNEIIVNGINGYLVKINDIDDLSKKIELLLKDNKMREYLVKNANETVKNFDKAKIIKEWTSVFKELLK